MVNRLFEGVDQLEVGSRYVSRGRTITEADIVSWCSLTGDWHVLHSDAAYAARSSFGQRIAPGLLVLAYAAGLGVPPDSEAILANYGCTNVRFVAPVFIGDTLHLEASVKSIRPRREGVDAIVTFDWDMFNQNGAMVMKSDLLILMAQAVVRQQGA